MDTKLPEGVGSVIDIVQDIGIALLNLGPIPLTVLAGVIFGLFAKMILNVVGIEKGRNQIIPIVVIAGTTLIFWSVQPPLIDGTAPPTMRYPQIQTHIVGATLGFLSIWIHRRFVKNTKLEKVLTEFGDNDEVDEKDPTK